MNYINNWKITISNVTIEKNTTENDLSLFLKKLDSLQKQRQKLLDKFLNELINDDLYVLKNQELTNSINELNKKIDELNSKSNNKVSNFDLEKN